VIDEKVIVFVDIETTGLDPDKHGVIEFGAVICDPAVGFRHGLQTLVNPGRNIAVSPKALEVNGISEADFRAAGVPGYGDFALQLQNLGARANNTGGKPIIGGWNVHFDYGFIRKAAPDTVRSAFDYHLADAWAIANLLGDMHALNAECYSSRGAIILENVATQFGVDVSMIQGERHRAMYDAELAARTYVAMRAALLDVINMGGGYLPASDSRDLDFVNSPLI
jgi:DNA polymerase III epsilon subunit-like protein